MKIPKPLVRLFPLLFLVLVPGIPAVFFSVRAPVLLVTDASFDALYGAKRIRLKRAETSLRLLRRVRPVTVSEAAAPDLIAISVKTASSRPYAVFFPYRYEAGAARYSGENPGTKVAVFGGRRRPERSQGGPVMIFTDAADDLYRAGCAAALLAGENPGGVLFFHDDTVNDEGREIFTSGLADAGHSGGGPVFLGMSSSYSQWASAACVVANGSASNYFERNTGIPAVLFTWADPGMTPRGVKAFFDDSPWALVERAVRELEKGEGDVVLPSVFAFLEERLDDRDLIKRLEILAKGGLQTEKLP